MEIEKKYLTEKIPFDITVFSKAEISQCYISTSPTIRIRKMNDICILTIKGKGDIAKDEYELEITAEEYNSLLLKAETPPVKKTRYFVPIENGLTAEVDFYHNALEGLITTEVEFESMEALNSFKAPQWFGRDVSMDRRYKNTQLSLLGIPQDD